MSIENAYDQFNDGTCNVPTGYEVTNSYGAFYKVPSVGIRRIAIYGDNFLTGYLGVSPPTDGALIKGYLGLGQSSAACQLDVAGTVRRTGLVSLSETVISSIALSTSKDSVIDSRNSSLTVTLADAGLVDQLKLVKLISRAALPTTVSCGRGSFRLTSSEPSRLLRFTTDGWVSDSSYGMSDPDSFFTTVEETKVLSTSISAAGAFGYSAAISGDGLTVIIGGSVDSASVGAAWIFVRNAGSSTWTFQQKLTGTGNVGGSQQGNSVAISADGNTVAIGGQADNSNAGAVWIFTRSAGVWTQIGSKLVGTGNTGTAQQGYSVGLSADGTILASGGPTDNTNVGATWIFQYSGGDWTQVGSKLVGTGNTGQCRQGTSVSISADGKTVATGGYGDNTNVGAAWVFFSATGTYASQSGILTGSGNTGACQQGSSVSLSADGNTLAVGGPADNSSVGAVWVFSRTSATWAQQGLKLVGTGGTGASRQGYSVSLSADGNSLAEYGYSDNSNAGSIWTWTRSNAAWTQQSRLVPSSGGTSGGNVSLSSNGACLLVTNVEYSGYTGKFYIFK